MVRSRIQLKHDTTANWNAAIGFVPLIGELIIYDDYETVEYQVEELGQMVTKTKIYPGVKIGDGNAYVQDLPFVEGDLKDKLLDHIENQDIHVALGEKAFWNNKINVDDAYEQVYDELEDEMLILTRN